MSSLGAYKDNLSGREKTSGGIGRQKKWGRGVCVAKQKCGGE